MPSPQNVHVDAVLTNIAIQYPRNDFIADRLLPAVPVAKQSDKYFVYGREELTVHNDLRAPGTKPSEIKRRLSTDSYFAEEHSLRTPVTDEDRQNADAPLEPDADAVEFVTRNRLTARELEVATYLRATATYANNHSVSLTGDSTWDGKDADILGDIETGKDTIRAATGLLPNTLVIPYATYAKTLRNNADLLERIKYSARGIVTADLLAAVFDIPNIVIAGSIYNSAAEGQAMSLADIWGDDVIMAYVTPTPGVRQVSFGYRFVWNYPDGQAMQVRTYRDADEGTRQDWVEVAERYDLKVTAKDLGYIIKNTLT